MGLVREMVDLERIERIAARAAMSAPVTVTPGNRLRGSTASLGYLIESTSNGIFAGQPIRIRLERELVTRMKLDHEHWSRIATEWVAWARTTNHDAFWAYRAWLLAFIGRGQGEALDVGCGEGRTSRVLKDCGYRVAATDPVEAFISAAKQAESADDYKVAAAANLPFADDSFDLALAYNVLMDVEDVPMALKEIGRVLRPTGTLVISIVHPFADRGRFAGSEPDAPFVLHNSYFGRKRFEEVEERNGLQMHFAGWSQPLENYMAALECSGFAVTSLREPIPDDSAASTHMERWNRIPLFLWLKARPLTF
jgi:SAM-dependent methyltransferase